MSLATTKVHREIKALQKSTVHCLFKFALVVVRLHVLQFVFPISVFCPLVSGFSAWVAVLSESIVSGCQPYEFRMWFN